MPGIIHSLHLVTVLALLSGMLLIIFGSIGVANEGTTYDMLYVVDGLKYAMGTTFSISPYIEGIAIYMIVLGAVITLVHLKGSVVVILKSNRTILGSSIALLSMSIIAEIGLIIYASIWSIYDDYALAQIRPDMFNSLETDFKHEGSVDGDFYKFSDVDVESSWEKLQLKTICCGVNGYKDYNSFNWANNFTYNSTSYNLNYPVSCCSLSTPYEDNGQGSIPISSFNNFTKCLEDSQADLPQNAYPCSLYMQNFVYQFSLIGIILASILIFLKMLAIVIIVAAIQKIASD